MKNIIIFWITICAMVYIINSCGSRKAESQKSQKSEKVDFSGFFRNSGNSQEFINQDLNLNKWYNSNTDDLSEFETDEMTVEPSDLTKPAAYTDPTGKKHILDNTKLTNKKRKQKNKISSGNSGNSELILKTDHQKRAEQKAELQTSLKAAAEIAATKKNTDRQQWSLWNLLWLLIPVSLYLSWKYYKKVNPVL
ncbi:hypothetical protein [Flavobacterium sp. T12S277]|uniref:hypothetical protein n=1 Tax=Flavobacterium sp. T12S277 TaxID=3402752 RepID=UPI003AE90A63